MLDPAIRKKCFNETERTRVVNVRQEGYQVYIGRAGHGQEGTFGNPYRVGFVCDRCRKPHMSGGDTLPCFKKYFEERLQDPEFKRQVLSLRGKVLGCFCRPNDGFRGRVLCHGQIIAALLDNVRPEDVP